jgi:hypothetical protein
VNQRIIALKKAAGIDDNPDQEGLDLFAQLIVQECDLYARRNWEHGTLLGGDLLNYFGVE